MRIAVVDDHPLFRVGVVHELRTQGKAEVVEAASVDELLTLLDQRDVDVVLLDVRLPGTDGIEGCRQVVARSSAPRVVMLSTFDDPLVRDAAYKAGASAFVSKEASFTQLLSVLDRVARGLDAHGSSARLAPSLTQREYDILPHVAAGKSNREIADALGIGRETVKSHLERLFQKFEVSDRRALIARLIESGLFHSDAR